LYITSYKLSSMRLPLKHPFVTSLRRVEFIDDIVLELYTDENLVGFGAAAPTVAITGESKEDIIETIEKIILPTILNKKLDSSLLDEVQSCCDRHTSAKACVDIALHDLLAREANKPLYEYLGGTYKVLETCITISLGEIDEMVERSEDAFKNGFTQLKIKLGQDFNHSIVVVQKIHKALPDAKLLLDANQAWSLSEAKKVMQTLKDIPILLIEQPLKKDEICGMAELKKMDIFPILADESVFNSIDAKNIVSHDGCDMINIKLMKCGGLREAKKMLDIAKHANISCMVGSMLENPISVAAAAHFALSSDIVKFLDLDAPILASYNPIDNALHYDNNIIFLTKNIGLGIQN